MSRSDSLAAPPLTQPCAITTRRRTPRARASARIHADRVPEHPGVPPRRGGLGGFRLASRGLASRGLASRGLAGRGELAADGIGFEVGDPVYGHRAVAVREHDGLGERTGPGPQVHAGLVEQAAAEPEPARGVVVAADQHDPGAGRVQPEQGVLAQLDRVHGGTARS